MDTSIPYYEDNTRVSNSAIGWFLNKGPTFFHAKLSGQVEDEKSSAMDRGTMIHMYLLQPDEFQKEYLVWNSPKPTNQKQIDFCNSLANTTEIEPNKALLSAFQANYSTTGQSEEKQLSKASEMAKTYEKYIEYIKNPNRTLITMYDVHMLSNIQRNINNHKLAAKLLNPPTGETHHEFHINWELHDIPCKSLLDSVNFDFDKKICTLMDLKTTVKIGHFEDSVNQYDYTRQLEFYTMALNWYLEHERGEDPTKWHHVWYIIAIDTVDDNSIRVFKFTDEQVIPASIKILHAIDEISWHVFHDKWEHTREYYEGDGAETLNL